MATLRRAAAREAGADDTARIVIEREPRSSVGPLSSKRKFTAAVGAVAGVLWALWELYAQLRGK